MYRAITGENAGKPHLFGKTTALVVTTAVNFPFGTAVPQNILGVIFFFWEGRQVKICLTLRHKPDSILARTGVLGD